MAEQFLHDPQVGSSSRWWQRVAQRVWRDRPGWLPSAARCITAQADRLLSLRPRWLSSSAGSCRAEARARLGRARTR